MSEGQEAWRSDTAHQHWDKQWQSREGRSDWLSPEPDVVAFARERFEQGDRLALDLGCGVGRHALALADIGFDVAAMDGSPAGLEELSRTAATAGLSIDGRLAEMTDLPYDDDAFDYVLSFNVIYHGDPEIVARAISEIRRVLKPGGFYQGTMLSKRNHYFGQGREVAPNTFVKEPAASSEEEVSDKGHPHFYCNAGELVALFGGFELLSLEDKVHSKPGSWHWHLIAEQER